MPKPAALTKKTAVRGSKTGRPVMALLDLLGRRWTLRIVWELRDGPLTSRALRTACDDASPTVMQARLSELREAGLVELLAGDGYRLDATRQRIDGKLPAAASVRRAVEQARGIAFSSEVDTGSREENASKEKP